jgi:hypothetical protein
MVGIDAMIKFLDLVTSRTFAIAVMNHRGTLVW